jgi:hypothetical protein
MKNQNPPPSFKSTIGSKFNRRSFLTAAGASALALPFIKPRSALAQCFPSGSSPCSDVNNIPSPNPWLIRGCNQDTVCNYNAAGIAVTGVRHYGGSNKQLTTFPDRPDNASLCLTIYPNVSELLNGTWDNTLAVLFSQATPREMMSCWHELAGGPNDTGGKTDASGHPISSQDAVNMQNYILDFRKANFPQSPLAFGAIECGNGNTASPGGWKRVQPFMAPNLDFYGNDLYFTHYPDPVKALQGWWDGFVGSGYSPNATIAVTECNAHMESDRPCFFYNAAKWVWNQQNRGARSFLCFWNGPGNLGGPWDPCDLATIEVLTNIGLGDYTNYYGC